MDRRVWGSAIVIVLITQILFVVSVVSYVLTFQEESDTYKTSTSLREERLLNEPLRGKLAYPNQFVISGSTYYSLMIDVLKVSKEVNLGYYILEIQYSSDFNEVTNINKIPLNLPNTTFFEGFAFDGHNFYTIQLLDYDANNQRIFKFGFV